jgi:hypothetical protein
VVGLNRSTSPDSLCSCRLGHLPRLSSPAWLSRSCSLIGFYMSLSKYVDFKIFSTCSIFFFLGHLSGEHVNVKYGDCRIYFTIMNMSLHSSYISYGKSDLCIAYLYELFWCPAWVYVMQQPSSEEWHLLLAHDPS